ncbi:hypothetical protein L6164_027312 [Bauhinia variegata]|uniref:Uncharacterized protein n=1 Tax=Bauhinia variegata TaxID=167791 RepID=A0ACB9LT88_BAUVA|nr:hypothetical protein L6164_027312 [Bauhinia variegata]
MATNVPARAVPATTALLTENAADGGGALVSGGVRPDGPGDGELPLGPGAGGEGGLGPGASDGVVEVAGAGDDEVGAGVGADGVVGAGVGGVDGAGVGVAAGVGAAAGGVVAVGGAALGAGVGEAPGACAKHEVAKSPKITNTWTAAEPIVSSLRTRKKQLRATREYW